MADNDSLPAGNTTPDPNAPPAGDASGAGSAAAPDELSVLKSRYQGQTAKVEQLTREQAAVVKERDSLKALLDAAQTGVIDKDKALADQIAAKDAEIAAVKREVALAKIEAKYPETFAVFGEDAAGFSEVKLAENEARLRGAVEPSEPETPRGNSPAKTGQAASAKPLTNDEFTEQAKKQFPAWPWSQGS